MRKRQKGLILSDDEIMGIPHATSQDRTFRIAMMIAPQVNLAATLGFFDPCDHRGEQRIPFEVRATPMHRRGGCST